MVHILMRKCVYVLENSFSFFISCIERASFRWWGRVYRSTAQFTVVCLLFSQLFSSRIGYIDNWRTYDLGRPDDKPDALSRKWLIH
jgi:hypothetical protein